MAKDERQEISIARLFEAPRELVYRAFVDPDQLCEWFGPAGFSVPCETVQIDARPGDCLVLAAAQGAPIFVNLEVWSQVDDVKLTLRKLQEESSRSDESG